MVEFNKGMDGFFHSLIPLGLRETLEPGTATYIRVRALSAILVIMTMLSVMSNLLIGGTHLFFYPGLLRHDLVSLAICLLLLLQAGLFYKFNNYWMSGLAFTNFYFLITVVLLIVSGGYDGAGKAILLTCPMVSFLIGGRQEGMQSVVATVIFGLILVFLKLIDFGLPNIFREESAYMIFSVNWIITVVVMMTCIVVYETELQKTHGQSRNEKSHNDIQ